MQTFPWTWPLYPAWIRSKIIHILPWLLNWLQRCLCMVPIQSPVLRVVLGSSWILMLCSSSWPDKGWRDPWKRSKGDLPCTWEDAAINMWWANSQHLLQVCCNVSSSLACLNLINSSVGCSASLGTGIVPRIIWLYLWGREGVNMQRWP